MYILCVLAGVDFLLPAVKIPLFAYLLIILLWICQKAVSEAKRDSVKTPTLNKERMEHFVELSWVCSADKDNVYSTTDGNWQIYVSGRNFWLMGEADQELGLTAHTLTGAMDQADIIINALTYKEKN